MASAPCWRRKTTSRWSPRLDEYIFQALRAGASGFLLKDTEPAELLQALRVVVAGDALLSPAVTRRPPPPGAAGSRPTSA